MSGAGRTFLVINFILVIGLIVACAYLYMDRGNLQKSVEDLKAKLSEKEATIEEQGRDLARAEEARGKAVDARKELASQLEGLQSERDRLAQKVQETQGELVDLQTQLQHARTLAKGREEEMERKEIVLQERSSEIESLTEQRDDARKQLQAAQEELRKALETQGRLAGENNELQEKLSALTKADEAKDREIAGLRKRTEDPVALLSSLPAVEGSVRDVRRDEKGELVFLAGFSGGEVKDGMQFGVFREDELVGRVEVVAFLNGMAGARILYKVRGQEIEKGDLVRTTY